MTDHVISDNRARALRGYYLVCCKQFPIGDTDTDWRPWLAVLPEVPDIVNDWNGRPGSQNNLRL